jgi:hypothetical protein
LVRISPPADAPVSRKIFVKEYNNPPDPDVTIRDGVEDSRWQIVGQKRREAEELTPPWLVLVPALQFGEFENWNVGRMSVRAVLMDRRTIANSKELVITAWSFLRRRQVHMVRS